MKAESDDERSHAMLFVDFANKRDIPLELEALEVPDSKWKSPEDLWEKLLQAEMDNTQYLLAIGDAAANSNDHALTTFLMPFHLVRSTIYKDQIQYVLKPNEINHNRSEAGKVRLYVFTDWLTLSLFFLPNSALTQAQVNEMDKLRTILAKVKDENKTPGLIRQLDTELGAGVAAV
jgi:ferritin